MNSFTEALISGLFFGFSSGISPGPLSALTISRTIQGGVREGAQVALSPLVTDLPIIVGALYLVQRITEQSAILGLISVTGGMFLFYLAYQSFMYRPNPASPSNDRGHSLIQGITTNFLNPYPYIFWITIGAPYAHRLIERRDLSSVSFFIAFYSAMLACKMTIVFLTHRGKQFLTGNGYVLCMRLIAACLLWFGALFVREGLHHFEKWSH